MKRFRCVTWLILLFDLFGQLLLASFDVGNKRAIGQLSFLLQPFFLYFYRSLLPLLVTHVKTLKHASDKIQVSLRFLVQGHHEGSQATDQNVPKGEIVNMKLGLVIKTIQINHIRQGFSLHDLNLNWKLKIHVPLFLWCLPKRGKIDGGRASENQTAEAELFKKRFLSDDCERKTEWPHYAHILM